MVVRRVDHDKEKKWFERGPGKPGAKKYGSAKPEARKYGPSTRAGRFGADSEESGEREQGFRKGGPRKFGPGKPGRPKFGAKGPGAKPFGFKKPGGSRFDDDQPRKPRYGAEEGEAREFRPRKPGGRDFGPPRPGRPKFGPKEFGARKPGARHFDEDRPKRPRFESEEGEEREFRPRRTPGRGLGTGKPERGERKEFGFRKPAGERRFGADRPERPRYGDRPERPRYGDRPERPRYGDRPERPRYGSRESEGERSERPRYGSKEFGAKRFGGDRPGYEKREPRAGYGAPRTEDREFRKPEWKKESSEYAERERKPRRELVSEVQNLDPRLVVSTENVTKPRIRPVWIFDNMVDRVSGDVVSGETIYVYDQSSKFLGSAIYNEESRIRARIFSLERVKFDEVYLEKAIVAAIERRRTFYSPEESQRLVFSDADGVPGLIVDKIGGVLVVQPLTLAVNRRRNEILYILRKHLQPKGMVVRYDMPVREKEGLTLEPVEVEGSVPEMIQVEQDGFSVYADPQGGQKTGLFLDQRFNRRQIIPYSKGKRVLDLFCYVGAWSFTAARAGAAEVVAVDSSDHALDLARKAADLNGFNQIRFESADVFDFVSEAQQSGEQYDVVVCDPPAFAKTHKQIEEAVRAYLSLNYRIMKLVPVGGIVVSCSCSQHVRSQEFEEMLETAARNARMRFHVVARGTQAPDHPILLGMEESEYLKCYVLQRVE